MSTWIAGMFYHDAVTRPNMQGLIVAHEAESTEGLFDKIRTFQDTCEGAPPTKFNSKKLVDWLAPLRSRLSVQTAGKVEIGRSMTLPRVHLSEFAFWGKDCDKSTTSVMQSVPDGLDTAVYVESTANGYGGPFYDLYMAAKNDPESEWEAFFFAWFEDPTYRRAVPEGFEPTNADSPKAMLDRYDNEQQSVETYGLDLEQLSWRRWAIDNKCQKSLDKFRQEYPSNDIEAFLMSGRPAFGVEALREQLDDAERFAQKNKIVRGKLILSKESWVEYDKHGRAHSRSKDAATFKEGPGPVVVFRKPHKDGQYAMGTDVSEGHGGDPSGTVVWHKRTLRDIADLHGQFTPSELAAETYKLSLWYNNAATCADATGVGEAFLVAYKRLTGRMYFLWKKDKLSDERYKQMGYKFNEGTRATLVDQYDLALRERDIHIRSKEAIQEHFTFVFKENGKPEHAEGCNDDHVLKRMLCYEMIKQEPYRDPKLKRVASRGRRAGVPGEF